MVAKRLLLMSSGIIRGLFQRGGRRALGGCQAKIGSGRTHPVVVVDGPRRQGCGDGARRRNSVGSLSRFLFGAPWKRSGSKRGRWGGSTTNAAAGEKISFAIQIRRQRESVRIRDARRRCFVGLPLVPSTTEPWKIKPAVLKNNRMTAPLWYGRNQRECLTLLFGLHARRETSRENKHEPARLRRLGTRRMRSEQKGQVSEALRNSDLSSTPLQCFLFRCV